MSFVLDMPFQLQLCNLDDDSWSMQHSKSEAPVFGYKTSISVATIRDWGLNLGEKLKMYQILDIRV
jgi:hypothetical protein